MSLTEFQVAHGGDLASAVVGGGSSCAAPVPGTAPRTSRRGRTGADTSAVTPAVTASEVPKAAGRTTRKRGAAATGAPGAIDEEAQAAAVRPKRGRAAGAGPARRNPQDLCLSLPLLPPSFPLLFLPPLPSSPLPPAPRLPPFPPVPPSLLSLPPSCPPPSCLSFP